ncbi:MAG: HisA/HisF-related TIM barrel protein [Gammaproteobacteria bacterium]
MQLIPVIDLRQGKVVHARQGLRDLYKPVHSRLCSGSDIDDVIQGFLRLYPFETLYIADLDAIEGSGHHQTLIGHVMTRYPDITFWIDGGFEQLPEYYTGYANFVPVLASESLSEAYLSRLDELHGHYVLSLDFAGETALGPYHLFEKSDYWPENVIVMTLNRVGSFSGPDFQKLEQFNRRHLNGKIIAAGGIRHKEDLLELRNLGIEGVLIASALHSGILTADDIASVSWTH